MAFCGYHPEMGEKKPEVEMEASLSHYGRHYFVKSKNPITIKQGVTFLKQTKASDYINPNNPKVGWYEYQVTNKTFEKLCALQDIGVQMLLD